MSVLCECKYARDLEPEDLLVNLGEVTATWRTGAFVVVSVLRRTTWSLVDGNQHSDRVDHVFHAADEVVVWS